MILRIVVIVTFIHCIQALSESECETTCFPNPAVVISDGCICGTTMPALDKDGEPFEAFLGIPYAKPPVGPLRFANPVRNSPWEEVFNGTYPRDKCIQKNDLIANPVVEGVEDCLHLNVYRPLSGRNSLPVMVYIHGGGFIAGSSHPSELGPERIMETRAVILVTFQYRLGALGFLSTGDSTASGNFGLKDQTLALRWVQRNIRRFDGNPDEVTIFGHSAGGSSVQLHMMSPLSEGLFARAISMSGSALAGWNEPLVDPSSLVEQQAIVAGVKDTDTMATWELVDALRKVDAKKLTESRDRLKIWNKFPIVLYTPVVEGFREGSFMQEDPRFLWKQGLYENVPWMTGYVPNEGGVLTLGLLTDFMALSDFIDKQRKLLPLFGLNVSYKALIKRFFDGRRVKSSNADQLNELGSEGNFLYPMMKSIEQYQNYSYWGKKPLTLYNFNFKSQYSFQNIYTTIPSIEDYGIVHGTDLIFLFRIAAFPDFQKNSTEEVMSRTLVKNFVHFAVNGTLPNSKRRPKRCRESLGRLELVQFTNSYDLIKPVEVKSLDCDSDEFDYLLDVLSWWSNKS